MAEPDSRWKTVSTSKYRPWITLLRTSSEPTAAGSRKGPHIEHLFYSTPTYWQAFEVAVPVVLSGSPPRAGPDYTEEYT
jgi:hypothetical protein